MRNILLLLAVLAFLLLPVAAQKAIICLDAGHGGSDPGAVGQGLKEKEVVLDVVNRLATILRNAGYSVYLTRTGDQTVSLSSRTTYANNLGAHHFLSVHCNAFNGSANGTETYCYTSGSNTSFAMRNNVNPQVVSALNTYNRGCKTANFYVVKYTNMPAILCELAFIDHAGDASKLGNATYRQQAAQAIFNGLQNTRQEEESRQPGNEFIAPQWSPDGSKLLVTRPGGHGLATIDVATAAVQILTDECYSGKRPRWSSENKIHYSLPGTQTQWVSDLEWVIALDGRKMPLLYQEKQDISVVSSDNRIWYCRADSKILLSQGDDLYFNPCLSPNGKKVLYQGLRSGIHVCDIDGSNHRYIGAGTHPCWSSDSQKILFDLSHDDGHRITASDIWMVDLSQSSPPINLTNSPSIIAQRPSLSPDERYLAFDAQGEIFISEFTGRQLRSMRKLK